MQCCLCHSHNCERFAENGSRKFILCNSCGLVFVPAEYHLTQQQEKTRYARHRNTADNKDYVDYLSKIADAVLNLAGPPAMICDFGSGREHVLADILNSREAACIAHDPLYGMVAAAKGQFDVVVACESLEHLRDPRQGMDFIMRLVKPHGIVYVRTRLYDRVGDFSAWWYAKDPAHIVFYCERTMKTVAELLGKRIVESNGKDVVIFWPP